jgi:hypothetical protein
MKLICIPATANHLKYVEFSLKILIAYFPNDYFVIVTPQKNVFKYLESNIVSVKNDYEYFDVSHDNIREILSKKIKDFSKWYYQQFLKYSIILKSKEYTDVLILDADSIPLSNFIINLDFINLNTTEYNKPYFNFIENNFPNQKLLSKSAIVNCMWFNVPLFNQMINVLENNGSSIWYLVILNGINKYNESIMFSEYETYANFKYNNTYSEFKVLKIFRRADLFINYFTFEDIIKISRLLKFDLIAFEDKHSKHIKTKILVFFIVLFIKIKLQFKSNR